MFGNPGLRKRIYRYHGRNKLKIHTGSLVRQHAGDLSRTINGTLSEATIDGLAKESGFQQRKRKVTASCFLDTLMFPDGDQAHTSLPDLTADLRQVHGIDISKVAMHNKFTPEAVCFIEKVLAGALTAHLRPGREKGLPLHFPRIKVKDSTRFSLPTGYDGEYGGYGNFSKKNGLLCLQYEYDLVGGDWLSVALTKGLRNDLQDSKETVGDITTGDLHIRDLGYVSPTYLSAVSGANAFFLNRLPPMAGVYTAPLRELDWKKVHRKVDKAATMSLEMDVMVYEKKMVPCRLILERVGDDGYARRLKKAQATAKGKGLVVSAAHKARLRYNAYITNVDASILPLTIIRRTYYLRWQVELVFKTWKSSFRLDKVKKVNKDRLRCMLLARLLWVSINWQLFTTLNRHVQEVSPGKGVSMLVFFKRCVKFAPTLRLVLLKRKAIKTWLRDTFIPLIIDCLCEAPWKKETHYQHFGFNYKSA